MRWNSRCSTWRIRAWLFAATTLSVLATPALALGPPPAEIRKTPPAWLGFLVMAVLSGIVIFISLMSSKRSHQD